MGDECEGREIFNSFWCSLRTRHAHLDECRADHVSFRTYEVRIRCNCVIRRSTHLRSFLGLLTRVYQTSGQSDTVRVFRKHASKQYECNALPRGHSFSFGGVEVTARSKHRHRQPASMEFLTWRPCSSMAAISITAKKLAAS